MLIIYWLDKKSGNVKSVNFDVVTAETHEQVQAITKHPVEQGGDVTDNARPEPKKLTIEGYVSNKPLFSNLYANPLATVAETGLMTFQSIPLNLPEKQGGPPIFTPGGLTKAVSGAVTSLGTALGLVPGEPKNYSAFKAGDDYPNRSKRVFDLLEEAKKDNALLRVITALETIDNMLIERMAVPRTTEDGNGASFQLDLMQVRIVKSETVDAPIPTEARGAIAESKGKKGTESKNDKKAKEQLKSVMATGFDGAAGLVGGLGKAITGGL